MATIVKTAIRSVAGWTANQAAMEAIYGVDGYETLLSTWESDIPIDLVASDEQWVAECYNDFVSGLDDLLGISDVHNPDATRNIVITVAEGSGTEGLNRHTAKGKPSESTTVGFMLTNNINSHTINLYSDFVEIHNIIVYNAIEFGANAGAIRFRTVGYIGYALTGCIFESNDADTLLMLNNIVIDINNNLIYNEIKNGALISEKALFYNNTIIGGSGIFGITSASINNTDHKIKNNTIVGFSEGINLAIHANNTEIVYNATDDTTATTHDPINSVSGISTVDFTSPSTGDYSIPTGSKLIDAGTDLSTDFTTDIVGNTRG